VFDLGAFDPWRTNRGAMTVPGARDGVGAPPAMRGPSRLNHRRKKSQRRVNAALAIERLKR
jgi:hypothetical protein